MFECGCGKKYKYASGLNNHKEKCGGGGGGSGAGAATASAAVANGGSDDITQSPFFTIPLTSFKPTANFTKEDLEMLEKRKQARLNTILEAQKKEKEKKLAADTAAAIQAQAKAIVTAAAAAASAASASAAATATGTTTTTRTNANGNTVVTNNTSNVGNEEHNASFNIKYVKRSEETQQVVRAVTAAAHEYCKGRIIVTSDEPAPGGTGLSGISTSVNAEGTTVYNHPTRTISIIETPPEEVSPEEEHDITLEKMTYLILSLIQNNNKLTKENQILRSIVAKIDPACFE
jgi:CCR4-NOT transcriptional regulation complex NOT5 subunit